MVALIHHPRWQRWIRGRLFAAHNNHDRHRNISSGRTAVAAADARLRLASPSAAKIRAHPQPHQFSFTPIQSNTLIRCRFMCSAPANSEHAFEPTGFRRLGYPNYRPDSPISSQSLNVPVSELQLQHAQDVSEPMSEVLACQTIENAARIASDHANAKRLSPRDISLFWHHINQLMQIKYLKRHGHDSADRRRMNRGLKALVELTAKLLHKFDPGELSHAAHSLATIMSNESVRVKGKKTDRGRVGLAVRSAVVGEGSRRKRIALDAISRAALPLLGGFAAGELVGLARAYGMTFDPPRAEDGRTVLDHIAEEVLARLDAYALVEPPFGHPEVVDILWSYANKDEPHPLLFEKVGDTVVESYDLDLFEPREVACLLWAYAKVGEYHSRLFSKVEEEVVATGGLETFDPHSLSILAWAYAKAEEGSHDHSRVFEELANVVINKDDLDEIPPQALATILWAFAKANQPHPQLFQKVAETITSFDSWKCKAKDISTILWAFATSCKIIHPPLLQKMEQFSQERRKAFEPQGFVNVLWAYASVGPVCGPVFTALAPWASRAIGRFTCHELATIAWVYAVANVDAPSLFDDDFVDACNRKADMFTDAELCQLHQWHLWQGELMSNACLSPQLRENCRDAFILQASQPSLVRDDILLELSSMGLQPEQKAITESGYRIDAVMTVDGNKVGISAEGPSHFVANNPTGGTVLKRRQIVNLVCMKVAFVPFWEWSGLGNGSRRKQLYLRHVLGLN